MPEEKPPHTPPASDNLPPKVGGVPSSNTPTLPPGVWNIDADGKVYGPYSRQQMRELIADGRLSAASKISKSGEAGWRRADQDPILKQLLTGIEPSDGNESAQSNPMHAAALMIEAGNLEVKSPLLAVILSLIVPGAGQMYTGHITGGVQILVVWIVFVVIGYFTFGVGYILALILSIWAIVNAYGQAKQLNAVHQAGWLRQRGL